MGIFRFHLIGMVQTPLLEVGVDTISELGKLVSGQRFVEARMAEPDNDGVFAGVLIATSRIQSVIEAD